MSSRMLIFVALLISGPAKADPVADSLFARGNALSDDGFYAEAADAYRQIIRRGYASAELDVNLGVALYRSGETGEGIYHMLRAARTPRVEQQARRHLEMMQIATPPVSAAPPDVMRLPLMVGLWVLGAVLLALGVVMVLAGRMLQARRWAMASLASGLILTALSLGWSAMSEGHAEGAVVRGPAVVYQTHDSLVPIGAPIQEGEVVRMRRSQGARVEVVRGADRTGWVDRHRVREF